MSQRTHKWVVCLAVVLTAPVGAAVWSVEGAIEPSTPSDVDGQFMFLGNHVGFGEQVYYNAFPVSHCCLVGVVNHNPNVHYLQGTSLLPPGEMTIEAFLGLWKDCNNDGVIGAVETAFTSYRAELLDNANRDICADSPHIQDGWVHEFRWIVPTPADRDDLLTYPPGYVIDDAAAAWGDFGDIEGNPVHYDCPQLPFPTGSFSSTGGLILYYDCQIGFFTTSTVNELDGTLRESGAEVPGLAFQDPYHPERSCGSLLNQRIPVYAKPDSQRCEGDHVGVMHQDTDKQNRVLDCKNQQAVARDPTAPDGERSGSLQNVTVKDPRDPTGQKNLARQNLTAENGDVRRAPTLSPDVQNASTGSWYGAFNSTVTAANQCNTFLLRWENVIGRTGPLNLAGDFAATNRGDGKRLSDFNMDFGPQAENVQGTTRSMHRQNACVLSDDPETEENDPVPEGCEETYYDTHEQGVTSNATPWDFGLNYADGGWRWFSNIVYLPPTYMGGTVREDLSGTQGGVWFTSYAKVGTNTTSVAKLPPSGYVTGTYGDLACPDGVGDYRGPTNWDCNPERWSNTTLGGMNWATFGGRGDPTLPNVSTYNLRDEDCYDGRLFGTPVYASGAELSEEGVCPTI